MAHRDTLGFGHYIFLEMVPSINYVIFPIVQTLSSQDLRDRRLMITELKIFHQFPTSMMMGVQYRPPGTMLLNK